MAKTVSKLDDRTVKALSEPGRYGDGAGLWLQVNPAGAKRWALRFMLAGRSREMGLGGYPTVSLKAARLKAAEARAHLEAGRDPIEEARREAVVIPTFGDFADEVVASLGTQWRNAKHRAQWTMTLTVYAKPIRKKLVSEITVHDVLKVLKPIWLEKAETASRLRGRIEHVLDAAKAQGFRSGENPAAWRGNLKHLLPARRKLSRGHHAAMAYKALSDFIAALRKREAVSALALEFTILTAARTSETIGAKWSEIDAEAKVWLVPAERTKAAREHRVPLGQRALAILDAVKPMAGDVHSPVFPGGSASGGLSTMAMSMLLRRMNDEINGHVTVHGFRSSFRDWAYEISSFPRDIVETSISHVVGDETERAYRRGDALEKRRQLMEAWANFIEPKGNGANVVDFKKAKS